MTLVNIFIDVVLSTFFISVVILIIFAIRIIFNNIISSHFKYMCMYLTFISLFFMPIIIEYTKYIFFDERLLFRSIGSMFTPLLNLISKWRSGQILLERVYLLVGKTYFYEHSVLNRIFIFACIWLFGCCCSLILKFRLIDTFKQQKELWKVLNNTEPPTQDILDIFHALKKDLKIKKHVDIKVLNFKKIKFYINEQSPFLTGLFKCCVVIPEEMKKSKVISLVIEHELLHYKNRDNWFKVICNVILSIHWYNPIIWYANAIMQNDIEVARDRVALLKEDDVIKRMYAHEELNIIARKKRR